MIIFHQNLRLSPIIINCLLLWLINCENHKVQVSSGHPNVTQSKNASTSSTIQLINSHYNVSIFNTSPSPLSTLSPLLQPSTITIKTNKIANDSGSQLETELTSIPDNSTLDPSLSVTTNDYYNVTLIDSGQSPIPTINSTIISSQSLSTSSQQDQQQHSIETPSRPFAPPFLEFIALSAFGLLVAVSFLVAGVYGCIKVYHSRYPVRITFGRKFSTFENPIYVQKASSSCEIDSARENQAGPTGIEA